MLFSVILIVYRCFGPPRRRPASKIITFMYYVSNSISYVFIISNSIVNNIVFIC